MSSSRGARLVQPRPPLEEYEHFDVAQEPWCCYRLEDGTVLRTRFILLKLAKIYAGMNPTGANMSGQTLIVPEVPRKNHGPPGTPMPVPNLQQYIVAPSVGFRVLEERPSVYLLGDGRVLQVRPNLANVAKTSVFDHEGQPQYLVTHRQLVMVSGGVNPPGAPGMPLQPPALAPAAEVHALPAPELLVNPARKLKRAQAARRGSKERIQA